MTAPNQTTQNAAESRDFANYTVYLTARIEADNQEDADGCAKRLADRVYEHPMVLSIESQAEADRLEDAPPTGRAD